MAAPDGALPLREPRLARRPSATPTTSSRSRSFSTCPPRQPRAYAEVVERGLAGETLDHVDLVLVTAAGAPITVEGNLSCTFKDGRPPADPRHLSRHHRAQAGGGAAPAGGADAGGGPAGGRRGARSQQHDDRRHRLQRVPAPEPGAGRPAPRRGAGDHQGRHPRRRRHPPAPGLHPPAVPPPARCSTSTRVVREIEQMLRRSLGEDTCWSCALDRRGRARSGPTAGSSSRCSSISSLNARDAMPDGGRLTIETGRVDARRGLRPAPRRRRHPAGALRACWP